MNRFITRGLALAALTGGITILGVTAANATDLPDLGSSEGSGILGTGIDIGTGSGATDGSALVQVPVIINEFDVRVLERSNLLDYGLLGNGITVDTGRTAIDIIAAVGATISSMTGHNEQVDAVVGVPLDISNTWVSVFSNEASGIVIAPVVTGGSFAIVDGVVNAFVSVPIDISCTSVTVLSDYENECTSSAPSNANGLPLTIDCVAITVLSDFERDCAAREANPTKPTDSTDPTDPTDTTTPVEPATPVQAPEVGGSYGGDSNGGTDDSEEFTDPCTVVPTTAITDLTAASQPMSVMTIAAAALLGALAAMGLMLLGSRLGRQQSQQQ